MGSKGQFLIELVVAMAIFSIAMVAMAALNVGVIRVCKTARVEAVLQGNAGELARGMINGVSGSGHGLLGAKGIHTAEADNIIFTDMNNNTIRYYLTADMIYKTVDGGVNERFFDFNEQVNVESMSLGYYDNTDMQLTVPIADTSKIAKVKIIATVKDKIETDANVSFTVSVRPRNLF